MMALRRFSYCRYSTVYAAPAVTPDADVSQSWSVRVLTGTQGSVTGPVFTRCPFARFSGRSGLRLAAFAGAHGTRVAWRGDRRFGVPGPARRLRGASRTCRGPGLSECCSADANSASAAVTPASPMLAPVMKSMVIWPGGADEVAGAGAIGAVSP